MAAQLEDGSFGMASDTALLVNNAAKRAADGQEGFGEAVGALLHKENAPHVQRALIAHAHRLNIPYTLRVVNPRMVVKKLWRNLVNALRRPLTPC